MNDVAWALQTARQVGPIPPPHAHAHPIHKAHLTHTGPLRSHVAGRTDHLPSQVPNQSFVLPADIISGLGEGNTESGFRVRKRMFEGAHRDFGGLPYGGERGPYGQGSGLPYQVASGGKTESETDAVPVAVAGGEDVLAPHEVAFAGMGDMEAGHKALEAFVLRQRAKLIKTLKGLPGPSRD